MTRTNKLQVLIVDDSAMLRRSLAALITTLNGVEIVGEAANVHEATAAVDELRPDVVILDVQIPGGNGLDVLAHIKRTRPLTEVIIFSNFTYEALRRRCREAGAAHFFDKSTEFDAMFEVLKDLVRRAGGESEPTHAAGGKQT